MLVIYVNTCSFTSPKKNNSLITFNLNWWSKATTTMHRHHPPFKAILHWIQLLSIPHGLVAKWLKQSPFAILGGIVEWRQQENQIDLSIYNNSWTIWWQRIWIIKYVKANINDDTHKKKSLIATKKNLRDFTYKAIYSWTQKISGKVVNPCGRSQKPPIKPLAQVGVKCHEKDYFGNLMWLKHKSDNYDEAVMKYTLFWLSSEI